LIHFRGGAAFYTGGILLYFEDLKQGTNKENGPKDIFKIASYKKAGSIMTLPVKPEIISFPNRVHHGSLLVLQLSARAKASG
jgi:hypothetical protein